jgi:hypothetical protein
VPGAWSADGVDYVATTNDVPENFERRTYRTPATNDVRFLRLLFELAP